MAQGTIKHYDADDKAGSLLLDDATEIDIDALSVEGPEVRSLRIGQRVDFDIAEEGGRKVARGLHIVTFS